MQEWLEALMTWLLHLTQPAPPEVPPAPDPQPLPDNPTPVMPQPAPPAQTKNGQVLYATAKSLLGKILPADNAADGYGMYGCAEAVNKVAFTAFGREIGGGASTQLMYKALQNNARFMPVADPMPGDIVICPTGMSTLGAGVHGHVGITGYNDYMSNDSETATWEANYTRATWEASFAARGFKTHYFRML